MADSKVDALTEDTSPATTDLVYVEHDPSGTPADRKVKLSNLKSGLGLTFADLSKLTDMAVALELDDDFFNNSATTLSIGKLGWSLTTAATGSGTQGTASLLPPGTIILSASAVSDLAALHLGITRLEAAPVFTCMWRASIDTLNDGTNKVDAALGLHDNLVGGSADATDGFYFNYDSTNAAPTHWYAATAKASTRTKVDTGVVVDTSFHKFKIICDGAGNAHFYIDDVETSNSPISTNLPAAGNQFTPLASIRKVASTAARTMTVDQFYLRWVAAR